MTTWEYAVVDVAFRKDVEVERVLNEFGANGWELVSLVRREAVFKRPKSMQTAIGVPLK